MTHEFVVVWGTMLYMEAEARAIAALVPGDFIADGSAGVVGCEVFLGADESQAARGEAAYEQGEGKADFGLMERLYG